MYVVLCFQMLVQLKLISVDSVLLATTDKKIWHVTVDDKIFS